MIQKRNLNKIKIIETAFLLADEIGINKVTFPKLAEKLHIKYPSLYNHFDNMNSLKIEMTIYSVKKLNLKLIQGLVGKSGEDAIRYFSFIYRKFAIENKTAYSLFMSVPSTENKELDGLTRETFNIIYQVLSYYSDDIVYLTHKSRALRSCLHGFISFHSFGYFQGDANVEESFNLMIDDFIFALSK